jgi:hypothetical protein
MHLFYQFEWCIEALFTFVFHVYSSCLKFNLSNSIIILLQPCFFLLCSWCFFPGVLTSYFLSLPFSLEKFLHNSQINFNILIYRKFWNVNSIKLQTILTACSSQPSKWFSTTSANIKSRTSDKHGHINKFSQIWYYHSSFPI